MSIILLVTSELDIRELFRIFLKEHYQIIEASNSEEGIEMFEQYKPDIIITDLIRPLFKGLDLVRYVRNSGRSVKIIDCSDYLSLSTRGDEMIKAYADRCIRTLVDTVKLEKVIHEVIG
jgi:DNA-binding response OmpR family regulator